jgi:hypothetical protein
LQERIKFFCVSPKSRFIKDFNDLFNQTCGSHPKIIAGTKPDTEIPYKEIAEEQGLEN